MVQTPQGLMHNLGTTIFDVDVKTGRITARPVTGSAAAVPGVNARFFGKPVTEIEYHFSGVPQGNPGGPVVTFNLHGNISNLLPFAIGTNSPSISPNYPQDTMGIYAYYVYLPYNLQSAGSPCSPPGCTVTIDSADGAYPFTTPAAQPYQYWKSILDSGGLNAQGPGHWQTDQSLIGGINYFRRFSFRTTGNISNFSFGLAIAAPWAYPHDSRFKVFYLADSLPNRASFDDLRSEPDWRRLGTTGSAAITPGGCLPNTNACTLSLTAAAGDTLMYYRSDSLRADQNAYITASVVPSALSGVDAGVFLGLKDPVKLAQMGISALLTGFADSTGVINPAYSVTTDLNRHSFRIAKYGTDSASIFSPAGSTTALVTIPYASLPPAPVRGSGPPNYDRFFFFGNSTGSPTSTAATSNWSNVNYEIGAAAP